jgi:disulfide bond formation protein DsbB
LKAELMHQQPVRCDEPAWTLFGISLAGWNLLASLMMTGICLGVLVRVRGKGRAGVARSST